MLGTSVGRSSFLTFKDLRVTDVGLSYGVSSIQQLDSCSNNFECAKGKLRQNYPAISKTSGRGVGGNRTAHLRSCNLGLIYILYFIL
jgi:hypothetical protein